MPQNLVDLLSVLEPRYVEIKDARKVSFWTPADNDDTAMSKLQEAEHDYVVYERRLMRAISAGVSGAALTLAKRQRDYRRRLYLELRDGRTGQQGTADHKKRR